MKPGPKSTPVNPYAALYYGDPDGFKAATTIAEYEARRGWPLFSVWPEAEHARGPHDPGWFLYTNANDDERAELGVVQLHALVRPLHTRKTGTAVLAASPVLRLTLNLHAERTYRTEPKAA